jgi:hypothetical protein
METSATDFFYVKLPVPFASAFRAPLHRRVFKGLAMMSDTDIMCTYKKG